MVTSGASEARLAGAVERLGQAARTLIRAAAARHGLSTTQAEILLRLGSAADGVTNLSAWLDVSQPTVSDAVAALERKGLLTRTRSGRVVSQSLTQSGRNVVDDLSTWDAPLREALRTASAVNDRSPLTVLLGTIAALNTMGVVSVARTCVSCRYFQPRAEPTAPHHCRLLDLPVAEADLRLDCPEHVRADR